jgi:Cu/Zn superoxide dismutase
MAVISLFFGDLHIASCPEQRQKMFKVLVLVSTIALVSALHGIAVLTPTKGNNVRGVIRFAEIGNTVAVTGSITGLKPNSAHGFHIHEFGYVNVF